MTTQAIEHYLYLLDSAFAGPDWHSLLRNLAAVAPEDWTWVPPGGARSVRDIVRHVGRVKLMAHDQAFGGGTLTWDDPRIDADEPTLSIPSAIAWLRMGHERLRGGVAALADDAELLQLRRTNWGELRETRWVIVVTMIQHDLTMRARSTACAPCIKEPTSGTRLLSGQYWRLFAPALNGRGHVLRRGEALMTTEEAQQEFMKQAEPQEEHRWLQKLVGEWTYEAKATMGPGQPPETMRGAVTARPFGGLWVMIEERGDPTRSDARTNIITLGYDPQKQRFIGTFVDSGSTFLWVYSGWLNGNVLTLEAQGPAMAGPGTATYRDVIEVVDDGHFVLRSRAPDEDGQWHEFMTSHYRRK